MAIRVIVNGSEGHMGRIVTEKVSGDSTLELAACCDATGGEGVLASLAEFKGDADVVIDFSHHDGTMDLLDFCTARNVPVVLCTTGQTDEELAAIDEAAEKVAIFRSANMSVGVALVAKIVAEVSAKFDGEIEIVEAHHDRKADAPSGTALMLARAAASSREGAEIKSGRTGQGRRESGEIGVQSIRMGNIVGMHEVMFGTNTETITIKHEAHDRALFADGALRAAKFLAGKPAGMYNMDDMLT